MTSLDLAVRHVRSKLSYGSRTRVSHDGRDVIVVAPAYFDYYPEVVCVLSRDFAVVLDEDGVEAVLREVWRRWRNASEPRASRMTFGIDGRRIT